MARQRRHPAPRPRHRVPFSCRRPSWLRSYFCCTQTQARVREEKRRLPVFLLWKTFSWRGRHASGLAIAFVQKPLEQDSRGVPKTIRWRRMTACLRLDHWRKGILRRREAGACRRRRFLARWRRGLSAGSFVSSVSGTATRQPFRRKMRRWGQRVAEIKITK